MQQYPSIICKTIGMLGVPGTGPALVGLLAVSLLVYTLRKCLNTYRLASCPLPA